MHSLTKPITIFPTIHEEPTSTSDNFNLGFNDHILIMRLKLPIELLFTHHHYLNIFKSDEQSLFYFKINDDKNNKIQYIFPITNNKNCLDLMLFILNTLSDLFTIYDHYTFDLNLTSFKYINEMKQFIKLPLNQITFTQGEIVTI